MVEHFKTFILCLFITYATCISDSIHFDNSPEVDVRLNRNCILPNHPEHGQWSVRHSYRLAYKAGRLASEDTILELKCIDGYVLEGCKFTFCDGGKWASDVGRCIKICPPRFSTITTNVTCSYKGQEMTNCTYAIDGTRARFKCIKGYEIAASAQNQVHICVNGTWDQEEPSCGPVCGQKSSRRSGGRNVYPWHVALIKRNVLTCSGTLLNQRIILTAAQCITDMNADLLPKENFTLAVGKYHRRLRDDSDNNVQFSKIRAIFIPRQYKGEVQNYLGDIAIIVAENPFNFTSKIRPACLDTTGEIPNSYGFVSSWNFFAKKTQPSEVLEEAKVTPVSTKQCEQILGPDFLEFRTDDKLCVNYTNAGLCKGSSGEGLIFEREGRYYIYGVASVSLLPSNNMGFCENPGFSLFTEVAYYYRDFIKDKLKEYEN